MMKPSFLLFLAACLLSGPVFAQAPVTVTLGPAAAGAAIPTNFIGLSFGMRTLLPDKTGAHFFSPTNKPLLQLCQNLGIKHLRVGGTSLESPPSTPIPNEADIDSFFAFVQAAQVSKVIYSLRLLETEPAQHYAARDAVLAKYIWDHYRAYLDCFAIGNEPERRAIFDQDYAITNFSTYLAKWRQFATVITNAVPEAKFAGPDAGSGNVDWTTRFAEAERASGLVSIIAEHFYVGSAGKGKTAAKGLEAILSPDWVTRNQRLYNQVTVPVLAAGLPFRFTEANDHFSGGIPDASNTFAGALWALDFLHWWAAHDTRGVDFHNTHWVANDVITPDANHRLSANPKGYGLKAFELGSQGAIEPLTLANPERLNLTAYAVRGAAEHYVTLINKEQGSSARDANVTIVAPGSTRPAAVMLLLVAKGEPAAKTGVTLGGAAISADAPWAGKWTPLPAAKAGQYTVKVPAVSAAIVKLSR
jgi:hypothetical protein